MKDNWPLAVSDSLREALNITINLIEDNPRLYPKSDKENIHRAVILTHNSLYYEIDDNQKLVIVLSFFNNHKNPNKRKL